jgi:hypothetical protein
MRALQRTPHCQLATDRKWLWAKELAWGRPIYRQALLALSARARLQAWQEVRLHPWQPLSLGR